MINKYQTGGAAPQDQQAQIQLAIMQISLATGEQPETIIAALKNGKLNFKKVLEALQLGNVLAAKLMIQQLAGTPMARLGTKLNYIRSLKGACPEGQEVKYFEKGGQVKCKCVDKAAGGEKVKDGKKEISDFKKKKACGGARIPKNQPGSKMIQFVEANKERKKKEAEDRKREEKWRKGEIIVGKDIQRGNGGPNTTKRLDSAVPNEDVPSHDRKANRHKFGGSLNGIPFTKQGLV